MYSVLFWILTVLTIGTLLFRIIKNREFYSLNTYLLVGVYFPLCVSFINWSYYHVGDRPDEFYYVMIVFNMVSMIFSALPQKKIKITNIKFNVKKGRIPIEYYNIIYAICILYENKYISGFMFPSLMGIDIHTARVPILYFITTAIYFIAVMNMIEFWNSKKRRYIVYLIFLVALNVISKASRIDTFICTVQLLSLVLFKYFSQRDLIQKKDRVVMRKKKKIPALVAAICIILILVTVGLQVGNNRMNSFGKYNILYSDGLQYTGPASPGEVVAYYYGYFPMSFDNLAYNITLDKTNINFIGLNTFRTLYFGIFQFDNLFGLSGGEATRANQIRCKAAAVTTGFWDFYYDYGLLCFIPMVISFAIYYYMRRKMERKTVLIETIICFFYWIPMWMFLSFDNRIFDYQVLWHIILICVVLSKRYSVSYDENQIYHQGSHQINT